MKKLKVKRCSMYGKIKNFHLDEIGEKFASIAGKKCLNDRILDVIRSLGYEVEIHKSLGKYDDI